jgi:hypothetical protein
MGPCGVQCPSTDVFLLLCNRDLDVFILFQISVDLAFQVWA